MDKEGNYKTVKWVLLSLNLCEYTHISIREHLPGSTNYLGGGKPGDMIRRFGDRVVLDSSILNNILCLYVVPVRESDHWGDYCDIGRTDGGVRVCSCTGSCSSCSAADGISCPLDQGQAVAPQEPAHTRVDMQGKNFGNLLSK